MDPNHIEIIGYTGSILVAISLMMKSLLRLRIINLFGALFFTGYGLLLHAYPVAFLNGVIVCIDVYYLIQMWRQKDFFTFMEVKPTSDYLRTFVEFYKEDISSIIPAYIHQPQETQLCFFILRNMVPTGLFIVNVQGEEALIKLDYVIPNYRDFKIARFIFEENPIFFEQRGVRRFVSEAGSNPHSKYLEKMGFVENDNQFFREIKVQHLHDKGF